MNAKEAIRGLEANLHTVNKVVADDVYVDITMADVDRFRAAIAVIQSLVEGVGGEWILADHRLPDPGQRADFAIICQGFVKRGNHAYRYVDEMHGRSYTRDRLYAWRARLPTAQGDAK